MSTIHTLRKLRELAARGDKGVRRDDWKQSEKTVPDLISDGHAVVETRMEPVDYLVITEAGMAALRGQLDELRDIVELKDFPGRKP